MDESSMIQLPMELFDHLDNPAVNNPELYQMKMMEDAENRALSLKKKFSDLDVRVLLSCERIYPDSCFNLSFIYKELRTSVEAETDAAASGQSKSSD